MNFQQYIELLKTITWILSREFAWRDVKERKEKNNSTEEDMNGNIARYRVLEREGERLDDGLPKCLLNDVWNARLTHENQCQIGRETHVLHTNARIVLLLLFCFSILFELPSR